ncbi:MAG: hypothetical protein J7456_03360, partial [Chloroflexus sp.]|nr:hypothetical protein [Chloroflexus sp.]
GAQYVTGLLGARASGPPLRDATARLGAQYVTARLGARTSGPHIIDKGRYLDRPSCNISL